MLLSTYLTIWRFYGLYSALRLTMLASCNQMFGLNAREESTLRHLVHIWATNVTHTWGCRKTLANLNERKWTTLLSQLQGYKTSAQHSGALTLQCELQAFLYHIRVVYVLHVSTCFIRTQNFVVEFQPWRGIKVGSPIAPCHGIL